MTIYLLFKGIINGKQVFDLHNSSNGAKGQVVQFTHNDHNCYALLATHPDTRQVLPLGSPLWNTWSGATAKYKLPHVYFEKYDNWWLQVGTTTPVCKSDNTTTWETWYVHPLYAHYPTSIATIATIGVFNAFVYYP